MLLYLSILNLTYVISSSSLSNVIFYAKMSCVGYTLKKCSCEMPMWKVVLQTKQGEDVVGNKTDNSLEMDGRRNTSPVYTVFQYTTLEQSHKMSKSGSNEKFPQFAIQIKTAKCIHSVVCHHSNGHGHPHDSLWCSKHSHSLKQTMWYSHCYKII